MQLFAHRNESGSFEINQYPVDKTDLILEAVATDDALTLDGASTEPEIGHVVAVNGLNSNMRVTSTRASVTAAHRESLQIAIAAMPDKDPNVLSACINADGTISTYTWPNVPDWLTKEGVRLRNAIAASVKDASLSFTQQSEDKGRLAETEQGVLVRTFRKGTHKVSLIPNEGRTVLYEGPLVSQAIYAWYNAFGIKVWVLYHRGNTLYPVPEPGTTTLWMIPTTRPASKHTLAPVPGHVLRIDGKNFQVIETATDTEQ